MKTSRKKNIFEVIKKELADEHPGIRVGSTRIDWDEIEARGISGVVASSLDYAVSVAYPLNRMILSDIKQFPTLLYKHHYREINGLLDRIAHKVSRRLEHEGYRAVPVPASLYVDYKKKRAHIPHRSVALKAGIGWLGRNNCVVDKTYGCGIRLVTILTDARLPQAKEVKQGCRDCYDCIAACPVQAIKEDSRKFDLEKCAAFVRGRPLKTLGVEICGVCIKACRLSRLKRGI